jgi:hypothetical protein
MARIAPAPAHTPSTAAIIGCGQWRIAFTTSPVMRVNSSSRGMFIFVSGPMISCTSPPEEKLPPSPVITTALTPVSLPSSRKRSRSSAYESNVSGFLRSGRLSVITPTLSSTRHRKCLGFIMR